jgi:hypothetical protein
MQFIFFVVHAFGLLVGTVYNANTPDLYENNAHHKMGWVFTWFIIAWILLGIINTYATKTPNYKSIFGIGKSFYQRITQDDDTEERRWSGDSGHGTEGSPSSERGPPSFSSINGELPQFTKTEEEEDAEKRGLLRHTRIDKFLLRNVRKYAIGTPLLILRIVYGLFERTFLILGFAALCTGFVTYGGIFRNREVFTGLAHFIKGGIFFWIGVLTISRWAGAFSDFGWAWNVKPPASVIGRAKARVPSMEFVESMLICIYGVSNVWLEHLNAAGQAWSPMDYEHVSITILFFGGGLVSPLKTSARS